VTEAYLQPPRVITNPGPEYADDTRRFQGIPGIERAASGRLWATWYGGHGESEDNYNCIFLASSTDEGQTWSSPLLVIDPDGDGPTRAYDPCLWHDPDGRLWLFWAQGYQHHTDERAGVWAITTDTSDAASPRWSAPRRLCDGIMMNKPITTQRGQWLIAAARWKQEGSCVVWGSCDIGASWQKLGAASVPEEHRSCDEHMIIERTDGSLWMLVRTKYGIGQSVSDDGGYTWSAVEPSQLAHPETRFFIRRLCSGRMLLVKHGPLEERTERSHLTAYLSQDEGVSWLGGLLLDERTGVSYPDGVEDAGGRQYLIYDYDRRGERQILMATFTEADILSAGGDSTADSDIEPGLRMVVNQATDRPA
jgi:hypothetical protein